MTTPHKESKSKDPQEEGENNPGTFKSTDLTNSPPRFEIPNESWTSILSTPCCFSPEHFLSVIDNIVRNPNLTSTRLFRAEILYDSNQDAGLFAAIQSDGDVQLPLEASSLLPHLKAEYRPLTCVIPQYKLKRVVVRNLIPRNPQLDKPLAQTVNFYEKNAGEGETHMENLVLYTPHLHPTETIPFYHPKVRALAIVHSHGGPTPDELSIHYSLLEDHPLVDRLIRTALKLLQITHKHATGMRNGYTKRVHHDQIIPQKRVQDTYAHLKKTYAKKLTTNWAEKTDPSKHVFEDLAIAAFLMELWKDMYDSEETAFPGFVDIGCGNGILVFILLSEGYSGWGFDARKRKSWSTFSDTIKCQLKEMVLIPEIFRQRLVPESSEIGSIDNDASHNGVFPAGTFIISNHADELTPWTPILSYFSGCPFIAIPCCSHSLTGARHRFSTRPKEVPSMVSGLVPPNPDAEGLSIESSIDTGQIGARLSLGPASGSLAKKKKGNPLPSAYASLAAYVMALSAELGFKVDQEMLRIPSTRNLAVLGRIQQTDDLETKHSTLDSILQREIRNIDDAAKIWVEQAIKLQKKSSSH
jgi:tRNASer (uridine44-2'-O)-methyltransferase